MIRPIDLEEKIAITQAALGKSLRGLKGLFFPAADYNRQETGERKRDLNALEKCAKGTPCRANRIFDLVGQVLEINANITADTLLKCSASEFFWYLPETSRETVRINGSTATISTGIMQSTEPQVPVPSGNVASDGSLDETTSDMAPGTGTHFIGEFPEHLHHVISMIQGAVHSLCAMVDCVDYGSFSAPDLHEELIRSITDSLKSKPGFTVRMLITSDPEPISKSSPFHGRSFEELRKDPVFTQVLERYLRAHKTFSTRPPKRNGQFIRMLQQQQQRSYERLIDAGPGADIRKLDGSPMRAPDFKKGQTKKSPPDSMPPNRPDLLFWIRGVRFN